MHQHTNAKNGQDAPLVSDELFKMVMEVREQPGRERWGGGACAPMAGALGGVHAFSRQIVMAFDALAMRRHAAPASAPLDGMPLRALQHACMCAHATHAPVAARAAFRPLPVHPPHGPRPP